MQVKASNVQEYLEQVPEDRKEALKKLMTICNKELKGFNEEMNNGMIGYVVPHKAYPEGYHCDPKLPLPFINIASQKNFIALYHMGIYADASLLEWFVNEYPKHAKGKLDMGKSCIRFKKMDDIPYGLIQALLKKTSMQDWILLYEKSFTGG
jgi:hypothetical protein